MGSETRPYVVVMEYERGWGARVDEVCYFDTWEEAASDALGVPVIERDPCQELRDEVDRLKARIHEIAVAGLASSPKAVVVQAMARDLERLAGIEERR